MARIGLFSLTPLPGNLGQESLIAGMLSRYGDAVDVVVCNGLLTRCFFDFALGLQGSKAAHCFSCFDVAGQMQTNGSDGGSRILRMSELVALPDQAGTEPDWASVADVLAYRFDGYPVGTWLAHALRIEYYGEHWERLPDLVAKAQDWRRSIVTTIRATESYLRAHRPDALWTLNGLAACEAAVAAVAARHGVPCSFWEGGPRPKTWSFGRGDPICFRHFPDDWQRWRDRPLSVAEAGVLDAFLADRLRRAGNGGYVYSPAATGDLPALRRRLGLQPGRATIVAFANVSGDTNVFAAQRAFGSQSDWLSACVGYALDHPERDLVIRVHPAEADTGVCRDGESQLPRDLVGGDVRHRWPELPANVRLVEATDDVSSYDLLRLATVVTVYATTVGVEAAALGLPVVSAGWSHYADAGFCWVVHQARELGDLFDRLLASPALPPHGHELARRYLYFWMFRAAFERSALDEAGPTTAHQAWQGRSARDRLHAFLSGEQAWWMAPPAPWRPVAAAPLARARPLVLGRPDWQDLTGWIEACVPYLQPGAGGPVLKILTGDVPLEAAAGRLGQALQRFGPPATWPDIDLLPGSLPPAELGAWFFAADALLLPAGSAEEGDWALAEAAGVPVLTPADVADRLPELLTPIQPTVFAGAGS